MPTSILVIALTFSERNGASSGGDELNAAEQIAAMYSASEGAPATVAVATKPAANAIKLKPNRTAMLVAYVSLSTVARAVSGVPPNNRLSDRYSLFAFLKCFQVAEVGACRDVACILRLDNQRFCARRALSAR